MNDVTPCLTNPVLQVSGLPVCTLLGGKQQDSVLLYRAITQGPPKDMMEMVRKFKEEVRNDVTQFGIIFKPLNSFSPLLVLKILS